MKSFHYFAQSNIIFIKFTTSTKNLQTGTTIKKMRKAFSLLPSSSQFSKAKLKLGVKFVKQDYNLPELTSPEWARLQMIIKKFAFKERKKPMNLLAIRASFRYNVSNITFSTENLVLIIPSFQLFD